MLFSTAINPFNQIVADKLLEWIVRINSFLKFGDKALYEKAFTLVIRHPSYLKQLHILAFEEATGANHSVCVEIWDFLKTDYWEKLDDGVWRLISSFCISDSPSNCHIKNFQIRSGIELTNFFTVLLFKLLL